MASSPEDNSKELVTADSQTTNEQQGDDQATVDSRTSELDTTQQTTESNALADGKISLFLKATSDVPIIKRKKWQVDENHTIKWVIAFIKKYLKLEERDTIFLYVAQAFAPSPDQQLKNLYECFGADGKLVLHYSKTPAWG